MGNARFDQNRGVGAKPPPKSHNSLTEAGWLQTHRGQFLGGRSGIGFPAVSGATGMSGSGAGGVGAGVPDVGARGMGGSVGSG